MIHTDNGAPFASVAPGGLSRLSLWWIKLGIVPERSKPACPQENGRHERLHLTLKQATAQPPKAIRRAQERAFQQFQHGYNEERPHEALGYGTPARYYQASDRRYPRRVPEPAYGNELEVRRISNKGELKWKGERTFISEVFAHEYVGLKAVDERWRQVLYGPVAVGWFDTHAHRFQRSVPRCLRPVEDRTEATTTRASLWKGTPCVLLQQTVTSVRRLICYLCPGTDIAATAERPFRTRTIVRGLQNFATKSSYRTEWVAY